MSLYRRRSMPRHAPFVIFVVMNVKMNRIISEAKEFPEGTLDKGKGNVESMIRFRFGDDCLHKLKKSTREGALSISYRG